MGETQVYSDALLENNFFIITTNLVCPIPVIRMSDLYNLTVMYTIAAENIMRYPIPKKTNVMLSNIRLFTTIMGCVKGIRDNST